MSTLCNLTAIQQRQLVQNGDISARELLEAHLAQIDSVNPGLNAIVTLTPELALEMASRVDQQIARGENPGLLAGLPIAHKDLVQTKGIRTTFGSRLHADFVPTENDLIIDRLQAAGAVTIGKTNTPEWGAGSQTFNDVFGATRNPYDTSRTCGGSSGGAAVALAARMTPIADGSDLGGSLRNPASFCNVVGFRTSVGRVPTYPASLGFTNLSVLGPMARNVADCALMLAAIAGPDTRTPNALPEPGETFLGSLDQDVRNLKIGWSPDFGGQVPVAAEIRSVVETSASVFEALGCELHETCPDFSGGDHVFKTLRAWSFAARHGDDIRNHPHQYKETIRWNTEQGLKLTGRDLSDAEIIRTQIHQRMVEYFNHFDFLLLPTTQVAPFPLTEEYVTNIDGVEMDTYIDWMKSCYLVSVTDLPAISVPAGFTPDGLPVGIQIIGRHRQELAVLRLAHAFEQATMHGNVQPDISS